GWRMICRPSPARWVCMGCGKRRCHSNRRAARTTLLPCAQAYRKCPSRSNRSFRDWKPGLPRASANRRIQPEHRRPRVQQGTNPERRRWLQACAGACLLGATGAACGQTALRFARLENVPDQFLGGEILVAVYKRLGITVEFVDLPAKRSLLESSEGRVDGEVQRILAVQDQYPTLIAVQPSFNFIEPTAFVTDANLHVDGWTSIAGHSIGIVRGVGSSERGTA